MNMRALFLDRRGATAIEYGLLAACVALLIISSMQSIGPVVEQMFIDMQAGFTATP